MNVMDASKQRTRSAEDHGGGGLPPPPLVVGVVSLGRLHQVGRYAHPPERRCVPATVHVLVHLLGHLLSVAKVCGGDHHPEGTSWGGVNQDKVMDMHVHQ